jgi:hypothetical protein
MRVFAFLSSFRERTAAWLDRVFGDESVGPVAGSARQRTEAGAAVIEDLERSLNVAFEAATTPGSSAPAAEVQWEGDNDAARELFASIAASHSQPVKSFIFELRRGSATSDWIEVCHPVMGSIAEGAGLLGLSEIARSIDAFNQELGKAKTGRDGVIDDASRSALLACYDRLVHGLPATFALGEDDRRREGIILHALLRQIPDVGHVTLERLYGVGLTSVEALHLATSGDLAAATGIPDWLCERICAKVQEHRAQLDGSSPESPQREPRARLTDLLTELRRLQEQFRSIARHDEVAPRHGSEKRECLRARQACVLRIDVLLAELGQVELVDELRKLAVERRIDRLEGWLAGGALAPQAAEAQNILANSNPQPVR